ncbi:MAG: 1-(5-phosphoribosyl)-5-[(5-phosphoribosylamino)methylideneamino]imidazole-4-carboxamide isomerase [Candidatus Hydrothermarchaeales archaeon]
MSFLVIPALDLKDGKCVQLVQGDPNRIILSLDDPVGIALQWQAKGAPRLHLVDLDGAIQGVRKNESIVRDILGEIEIPVQFGGGIRSMEDARLFLDLGVARVILGTLAVQMPDALGKLAEEYGADRITIALDSKAGNVVVKGWTKDTNIRATEIVQKFERYASEVLFTNVDVEGLMKGPDEKSIREIVKATSLDVIASGGISSLEDIECISKIGALGVVIGSALYSGEINLEKALKLTS